MVFFKQSALFLAKLRSTLGSNCTNGTLLVSKFSTGQKLSQSTNGYSIVERGKKNTASYRAFFRHDQSGQLISPFHDIPLYQNETNHVFNLVVEIPRWTNAKMEINKENKLNPIVQDTKKGKLRHVNNVFPHHGYIWNYGGIPQTWEDPNVVDEQTGAIGDNDPIDVLELGSRIHPVGSVIGVKVLGAMGLIDEGEADWKILTIDVNDPMASQLNDVKDIESAMPGLLNATHDWFKFYKVPTGKPVNKFAMGGTFMGGIYFDRSFALDIIKHDHDSWKKLIAGQYPKANIQLTCTLFGSEMDKVSAVEAEKIVRTISQEYDSNSEVLDDISVNGVSYINRDKY